MAGRLMRTAATASMVSSTRTNRARRNAINQTMAALPTATPTAASAAAPQEAAASDLTKQLQELAKLRDQGILTEEEFAAKKQQILGI